MVNNDTKLINKVHLQKYMYLLELFVSNEVEASYFQDLFLKIRREDQFWMSGQFTEEVSKVLDAFFLDVDEYNPQDLFDPNDNYNINEVELQRRAIETLNMLRRWAKK